MFVINEENMDQEVGGSNNDDDEDGDEIVE